ncbi:MAG: hypothetical protein CME82_12390 [Halomonas sp.]|nr:hypothetical protein [Halomonas sp.]
MSSRSMLRILVVVDHLDSGGAPVVVRDLIAGMVTAGAEVTLLILSDRKSHRMPAEVHLVTMPYVVKGNLSRWMRYRAHAKMLDRWLKEQGHAFDLVYAHLHHAHQVVSRSRLRDVAWYCLHADPVIGFLGNKRGFSRFLKKRKVRALYQGRKLVTVSQAMLDRLCLHFGVTPSWGVAIHNPVAIDNIRRLASCAVDDVPDDYLIYVGRMDIRQKRLDRLLDAYLASGAALPLIMVGSGVGLDEVRSMIKQRELEGRVLTLGPRENPYPYIDRARALLLSSDYEGFPLVLLEALACQTPVISVDCPTGPAEILTGDLASWLVPLDSIEAFGACVARLVNDTPQIDDTQCEHYRLENVVERYLALSDDHRGAADLAP